MTVSRRDQWSWGGSDDGVKPLADCLNMLIRCAGGDGNMVLNVGPMPDGEIAPEQIGRLQEIGRWLAKYGESIYGTRGGPYRPAASLVSTRRENTGISISSTEGKRRSCSTRSRPRYSRPPC